MTNAHRVHDFKVGFSKSPALIFAAVLLLAGLPKLGQSQTFTVLYSFTGGADGANPQAGVILDGAGNVYGTTIFGGDSGCGFSCGVVFTLDPQGNEAVLYSFTGAADGALPRSGLTQDGEGNLYGTTYQGGAFGFGTVFRVDHASGKEIVVHSFGPNGQDGAYPYASLIKDSVGNGYGTTSSGAYAGTVFEINKAGEKVLYTFLDRTDGGYPYAGLVRDKAGNLYGTTALGGDTSCAINPPLGCGTVFKVDTFGNESALYSFTAGTDGALPWASLTWVGDGFYGTTIEGGGGSIGCVYGCGTVFRLRSSGKESVLHAFTGAADGSQPYGSLMVDESGNFYGTTYIGGDLSCDAPLGCGTIYKVDKDGNFTTIHTFEGASDGAMPLGNLAEDKAGNFYGTASSGGTYGYGTVYKITP